VGLATSAVAAPAIAQSSPEIKWRLAASWPKSLDTLYGGTELFARRVGEITDGKFQIQPFAAGEIVPGLQVLDAVSNGTVESGFTYMGYYIGKNSASIFDASLPFGLTPRMHNAWMMFGNGKKLMDEVYDSFGIVALPAGQTGGQMFGWFRKELKSVKDFDGLKMRTAGFGGKVMAKLGVVPQQIAGGDIYPALEKGTIDACEWVGPYDDEKLGFNKVAKYYYTPGVMELEAVNQIMVGKQPWASLPPRYQAALRYAGNYAMTEMLASYDAKNAQAIARLVASGTQLSVLPEDVIKALRGALEAVLDEEAAGNEQFKKILANWRQFRADQHRWFSIADTRAELAVYRTDPQR
jgi:TRAP-type mannitol/chloroaromatic compound transport system substrate-binding protein